MRSWRPVSTTVSRHRSLHGGQRWAASRSHTCLCAPAGALAICRVRNACMRHRMQLCMSELAHAGAARRQRGLLGCMRAGASACGGRLRVIIARWRHLPLTGALVLQGCACCMLFLWLLMVAAFKAAVVPAATAAAAVSGSRVGRLNRGFGARWAASSKQAPPLARRRARGRRAGAGGGACADRGKAASAQRGNTRREFGGCCGGCCGDCRGAAPWAVRQEGRRAAQHGRPTHGRPHPRGHEAAEAGGRCARRWGSSACVKHQGPPGIVH